MKRDWKKENLFARCCDHPDAIGEGCQFRKEGWEEAGTMRKRKIWRNRWMARSSPDFVCHDCCHGLPQTWCSKIIQIYCLMVLEAKFILSGLKSRGWLDNVSSGMYVCVCVCVCVCMLSQVQVFSVPWTAACQSPLVHGILQARILE